MLSDVLDWLTILCFICIALIFFKAMYYVYIKKQLIPMFSVLMIPFFMVFIFLIVAYDGAIEMESLQLCKENNPQTYVTHFEPKQDGHILCCYYDESEGETCEQVKVP